MRLFRSFRSITVYSALLSVFCSLLGMLISILAGTPVGSTIVAADTDNAMFGTDRMLETLNAGPGRSPEQLIEAVSDAVAEFAGQAEQYDDQTMLCLVYNGKKA